MAVIAFWNNSKSGNIGQTASIMATATSMAIEHNYKVLIISTQKGDNDLEKAYNVTGNGTVKFLGMKESKFNSGIEGIMKLAQSGKLIPELIKDYTKIVLKGNRLEIIAGKKTSGADDNEQFEFNKKYVEIIKIANRYYDMVFVDLDRGVDLEHTKQILEISDIIVWNMEQKLETIESMEKIKEKQKVLSEQKIIYLINKYDKNSKYNVKNIIRNSNMKKNIYTIPYDIMFGDSIQDRAIDQWFLNPKIRRATIYEEHGFFVSEVNKLCEGIIYKLQELRVLR